MQPEYVSKMLEVLEAYERQSALIDALARQVLNTAKLKQIVDTSVAMDKFRKDIASAGALPAISSSLAISAETARKMSAALTSLGSYDALLRRLAQSDRWIASLNAAGRTAISAQLNQRLGLIVQANLLAEQAIARIAARPMSAPQTLGQAFVKMGRAQRNLWRNPWADIDTLSSTPRIAVETAGIDYYLAVHQMDVLPADIEVQQRDKSLLGQLSSRVTDVPQLIASVGSDLLPLYQGALEAVRSKNPDRVRHASTSLRELFTHVLHRLAPDSGVLDWIPEGSLLDQKGRPTRRARLLYVCRHVHHGDFATFIEADLKSALEFLSLLQKGTHGVSPEFTDAQLQALVARMESLLFNLIKLGGQSS